MSMLAGYLTWQMLSSQWNSHTNWQGQVIWRQWLSHRAPQSQAKTKNSSKTYFPVLPSHSLIDLSNEALASNLVSGENRTSFINCWCPVILDTGFLSFSGDHRNSVKSSEPETSRSGPAPYCRENTLKLQYERQLHKTFVSETFGVFISRKFCINRLLSGKTKSSLLIKWSLNVK